MAAGEQTGLLDLEKELSCSICTEVLYQPLTLLDCLHTFCGSCLKEWFLSQASQASTSKPNPYTCPSCRASVRETRPNATVTTLLDMYLRTNPQRKRTEEEKEELRQKYKPGEQVLPRVAVQEKDSDDERMLAEVREMSLREVGVRAPGSYERGVRHRTTERRRDLNDNTRQTRRHQQEDSSQQDSSGEGARRQIGHQSSLRSLMSSSEIDSSEMEEEILRLVDEGWLDGIDLNTLDTSQVDELSERIADAYRRRHRHRSRAGAIGAEVSRRPQDHSHTRSRERSHNRPNRSSATTEHSHHSPHPPVSRPRLLEAYPTGHSHQRRASSEQRRQTSPSPRSSAGRISSASQHQAARSATDLTERPPSLAPRPLTAELSNQGRRTTGPDRRRGDRSRGEARSETTNHHNATASGEIPARPEVSPFQTSPSLPPRALEPGHTDAANHSTIPEPRGNRPATRGSLDPSATGNHGSASNHNAPILYIEPSTECNRCQRQNIEYELHYNCSRCYDGNYNLCLQCYRVGRGCLHWYGFGYAALQRYQRDTKDLSQGKVNSPPHTLVGQRYRRPMPELNELSPSEGGHKRTSQNPVLRLESGAFCAICSEFANKCFWKCGSCNEGEWGFCNRCVNQGRCCTHPLLPVAHKPSLNASTSHTLTSNGSTSFAPAPEHRHLPSSPLFLGLSGPDQYVPLTLSTKCNICEYPVPPSSTRFHCPQCNDGDFNICTNSYLKLISDGRITTDNGDKGWRRCLSGHRMIVVGFEDSSTGQRRVVVKDLVGGHGLKNDGNNAEQSMKQEWSWQDGQQRHVRTVSKHVSTTAHEAQDASGTAAVASPLLRKYPPSGGLGMRVLALWSYWPRAEAQDELAFPKGAEIWEVENINDDWFVGCYAGRMGLFPGNYVRVLDVVRA